MTDQPLKIVRLTAENVKRLKAVEITPDGELVVIAGKNGQGKTSVLDAIEFALAGTGAQKTTPRPIRDGEESAHVVLDLGDLIVRREWKGERQSLVVTARDGAKYSSPQRMLDELVGRLSFDPLAFSNLSEKDQRAQLLNLVELPFDLDQLEAERRAVYDERTDINRDAKKLLAQLQGMGKPRDGLPAEPVEAEELSLDEALQAVRDGRRQHDEHEQMTRMRQLALERVERARAALRRAEQELEEAEADLSGAPEPDGSNLPDMEQLDAQLRTLDERNRRARAEADEINRAIAHATEYAKQQQILADTKDAVDNLTERLADIDARKADALAAAKMPVDGLGFDDTGVTYNGIPFSQCSAAERLRVSLAMAMALNPRLRVIRITDGSLLDSDNMRLIEEMARDNGFQCWIERVDESGTVGIVIDDGTVVSS